MKKFLIFACVALVLGISAALIGSTDNTARTNAEPSNKAVCEMAHAEAAAPAGCPVTGRTAAAAHQCEHDAASCTATDCSTCDKDCAKAEDCPQQGACEKQAAAPADHGCCPQKTE